MHEDAVNEFDARVGARLLDFFSSRSPWHRGLWNVGLCVTLQEVLEGAEAYRAGVLSDDSFGFLVNAAQQMAGTDPGVGLPQERRLLQRSLQSKPRFTGLDYEIVVHHEETCRSRYLSRWAEAIRSSTERPRAERTARAIASHLLDLGFSPDFLHRWWTYRLRHETGTRAIADLVDDAQQLALTPLRDFEVMAPVTTAIRATPAGHPREWRDAHHVSRGCKPTASTSRHFARRIAQP